MKNLILFLALVGASSTMANSDVLLKNIYSGTMIKFASQVELSEGQKSIRVANRSCTLRLHERSTGKSHIAEGETLTVSQVKAVGERETFNPSTGNPITAYENIKIKFKGLRTYMFCIGQNSHSLTIGDVESDGILQVITPKISNRYQIK